MYFETKRVKITVYNGSVIISSCKFNLHEVYDFISFFIRIYADTVVVTRCGFDLPITCVYSLYYISVLHICTTYSVCLSIFYL
jgi:hypothetical protein